MSSVRLRTGLIALGLVVCLVGSVSATVVLHLEIEDLAPMAAAVVVGDVNKVEASFNADKTKIHTRVWITPVEVLKGPADLGTVVVKTIGGQVGDTVALLPGAPRFEVGERVLVFLEPRQDGEGYLTIGFYQGKFKVFLDPASGKELLLRDEGGPGVREIGAQVPGALEKLRSLDEVRALLAGGVR